MNTQNTPHEYSEYFCARTGVRYVLDIAKHAAARRRDLRRRAGVNARRAPDAARRDPRGVPQALLPLPLEYREIATEETDFPLDSCEGFLHASEYSEYPLWCKHGLRSAFRVSAISCIVY